MGEHRLSDEFDTLAFETKVQNIIKHKASKNKDKVRRSKHIS